MTPHLLHALLQRWVESQQREDRRAAIVAMTIANVFRGKDQPVLPLDTFLVHRFGQVSESSDEEPALNGHRQTQRPEDQIAFARALTMALGGQDLTERVVHPSSDVVPE